MDKMMNSAKQLRYSNRKRTDYQNKLSNTKKPTYEKHMQKQKDKTHTHTENSG